MCALIRSGITIVKENAVKCFSKIAEKTGEDFVPYFQEAIAFLIEYMNAFQSKEYKDFCGHTIEAITNMCHAVDEENFKP